MRREEIIDLLFATPFEALCEQAARVLEEEKGAHVYVRGLIEFSNVCRRNCRYCGLRTQNKNLRRYTLDKAEIMTASAHAVALGADTIVLQSGEADIDPMWLADVVDCLRGDLNVPVTLSVGEHSRAAYALWKEAGAVRFLLKHETADPLLYEALHPGHALAERIASLRVLQRLGYEVGSGFMIGLPGQSLNTLADDIVLSRRLGVSMCGAGPFIPQHDTPLGAYPSGNAQLALRVMAVMRIAMPWANIPATTALATVDAIGGQRNGLLAGGNVLMPSFTPPAYGMQYCIYDNKNRVDMLGVRKAIESAGRSHSLADREPITDPKGFAHLASSGVSAGSGPLVQARFAC